MAQGDINITVVGNLTADPELRFTPSGQAVANFTVASNTRVLNKQTNEWEEGETTFIRCSAWREMAENVAESLTKGQRVIVSGRLKVRQYETREGGKGTSVECDVDDVGPSLKWASATITRNDNRSRQGPPQATRGRSDDPWASSNSGAYDDAPPF